MNMERTRSITIGGTGGEFDREAIYQLQIIVCQMAGRYTQAIALTNCLDKAGDYAQELLKLNVIRRHLEDVLDDFSGPTETVSQMKELRIEIVDLAQQIEALTKCADANHPDYEKTEGLFEFLWAVHDIPGPTILRPV
jgi:hypothetical protein